MLRARDFDYEPSDMGTQKRRMRRQRILETALPCAIIAALLVAAVFTVGHVGAQARARERARASRATLLASEMGGVMQLSANSILPPMHQSEQQRADERSSETGAAAAAASSEQQNDVAAQKREMSQAPMDAASEASAARGGARHATGAAALTPYI